MRRLTITIGTVVVFTVLIFFHLATSLHAQSDGVVFWNKMENDNGNQLISEIGPDLNLAGSDWHYRSAMFNDGWDNNDENSYAYANSTEVIASCQMGAFAFWWVPDDNGDTRLTGPGSSKKESIFFSNGATNYPQNDRYQFDFLYHHFTDPPSFVVSFNKRSHDGVNNMLHLYSGLNTHTGNWQAGDRVHIAFSWHNEPVILGEYIAALWVDGLLVHGWTEPDYGTLEGWRTTNPSQPYSEILRIGDSIFSYSADEQLRGPMDNIIFWNYAKSDFSDRFIESPLNQPPEAICQDVTLSTEPGICSVNASVDDGSFDPDGDPITLEQTPLGPYDLGETEVTLTVTDDKGLSDQCTATVTVVDQEAPVISSVSATPNVLWPPNHKMLPVVLEVDATDNCSQQAPCQITSVSSNEPVGKAAPDWKITDDLTVYLRAERFGKGHGRIYTITVECTDASGNISTDSAKVTVPHDKGKKKGKK